MVATKRNCDNDNDNDNDNVSFAHYKDLASNFHRQGKYLKALQHFQTALCLLEDTNIHTNVTLSLSTTNTCNINCKLNRQRILSNIILCRLSLYELHKYDIIANPNDLEVELFEGCDLKEALIEAKECVSLNQNWSKANYRLACVYVKLGESEMLMSNQSSTGSVGTTTTSCCNPYSNDACNALQIALRIDPRYTEARSLLTKLLRQRDGNYASNSNTNANNAASSQYDSTTNNTSNGQRRHQRNDSSSLFEEDVEDVVQWRERFMFYVYDVAERWKRAAVKVQVWFYDDLDDVSRGFVLIGFALLLLYIGFGGRFGLTSTSSSQGGDNNMYDRRTAWQDQSQSQSHSQREYRGNYGNDNAYNRYNNNRRRTQVEHNDYHYDDDSYRSWRSSSRQPHRQSHHQSFHLFDGSFFSMGILLGILFVGNRFFGISPFQALWFLQMLMGVGRGRVIHFGRGGFGGMMHGGGFGRRRGRWF